MMEGVNYFATIIHKTSDDKFIIYHGEVLEKWKDGFKFGFRINGHNYIWDCDYDYWTLIN